MPRVIAVLTEIVPLMNYGALISSLFWLTLVYPSVELNDLESFLLLELPTTGATAPVYELMATESLRFCRFPSGNYIYNDYAQVPKQFIPAAAAQELVQQGQKLAIFCIAHAQEDTSDAICGIELAHLMRIQCAYVFRGLPQTEQVQAYLVPATAVTRVLQQRTRFPESEIVTDQLDQAGEDLEIDWSSLAHDLNTEPLAPAAEERYRLTLWLLKLKNYVLQKAVALLMYVLERRQ